MKNPEKLAEQGLNIAVTLIIVLYLITWILERMNINVGTPILFLMAAVGSLCMLYLFFGIAVLPIIYLVHSAFTAMISWRKGDLKYRWIFLCILFVLLVLAGIFRWAPEPIHVVLMLSAFLFLVLPLVLVLFDNSKWKV